MSSPSPAAPARERAWQVERYFPPLVCAVAILTFIATLRFGFVYDDNLQIVNDPLIRGWHTLPLLFKTDVWRFWHPAMVGNYWRPFFMLWLMLNFKVFGLNAAGWHFTSVLVHAIASYLCYRVAKRLSGDSILALAAGLIFAVHPVHIETVAWVSGVTDSLMAIFFLGSLLCFLRGWEESRSRPWWFVTSSLLFAGALLCKETAAVLPAVAVGYLLLLGKETSGGRRLRGAVLPLLMYGVVFGAYWVGRHLALQGIGHSPFQLGLAPLILTWPSLLWFYLGHLVWPVGLSVLYDRLPVLHADWRHFWMPLLGTVTLIMAVTAVIRKEQRRLALFAAILFLAPLMPAFVLPAILPTDYAHDRYLYLPCFGFALLVGIVLKRLQPETQVRNLAPVLATVAIVIGLSAATSAQMLYWANDLLLFDRATKISPGNLTAFDNLGQALLVRGKPNEAVSIFRQVLQVDPNNWLALYNLGLNDFQAGHYAEAEGYLVRAADARISDSDVAALLADTLNHEGKFAQAEVEIRRALTLRPNKFGYRKVLAEALDGQGKVLEARQEIRAEVQSHPDEHDAVVLRQRLESEKPSRVDPGR
jgi:protein O-mannosyl-transferase